MNVAVAGATGIGPLDHPLPSGPVSRLHGAQKSIISDNFNKNLKVLPVGEVRSQLRARKGKEGRRRSKYLPTKISKSEIFAPKAHLQSSAKYRPRVPWFSLVSGNAVFCKIPDFPKSRRCGLAETGRGPGAPDATTRSGVTPDIVTKDLTRKIPVLGFFIGQN